MHIPPLILGLIENISKDFQNPQRQLQDRREFGAIAADRETQLVDGEVDDLGRVLRVARFLEDQEAAGWVGWSGRVHFSFLSFLIQVDLEQGGYWVGLVTMDYTVVVPLAIHCAVVLWMYFPIGRDWRSSTAH